MNEAICIVTAVDLAALGPRDRLIRAATRLFCAQGIAATGVDAVLREASVAKMTLYKLFGSKDRLVEAVLEQEGRLWREWFLSALVAGKAPAREKLDRIFPLLEDWFAREEFYGCPFINAVGEHDKNDPRIRDLAIQHKLQVLDAIATLAREAGAEDSEAIAHQIGFLIDGAIVTAMVTRNPAVARLAAQACGALLDASLRVAKPPARGKLAARKPVKAA